MGSFIEINDTLRISKAQGFPESLSLDSHLNKPYTALDYTNQIFEFKNKPALRIYHTPPVRNFLVEDIDGKWVYWGLCHVFEITHDYVNKSTSGKFKIIYLNSPEEMKQAHHLIDQNKETNFFS